MIARTEEMGEQLLQRDEAVCIHLFVMCLLTQNNSSGCLSGFSLTAPSQPPLFLFLFLPLSLIAPSIFVTVLFSSTSCPTLVSFSVVISKEIFSLNHTSVLSVTTCVSMCLAFCLSEGSPLIRTAVLHPSLSLSLSSNSLDAVLHVDGY